LPRARPGLNTAAVMVQQARAPTSPGSRRWSQVTLLLTLLLVVAPVLVDLWVGDDARVFGYLAPDFFYYFTVARNYVELGRWTFDQSSVTNGFHPLWQVVLAGIYALGAGIGASDLSIFQVVVGINAGLIGAGIFWIARAYVRSEGALPASFVLVVPSALALLTAPLYDRGTDYGAFRALESRRPVVGTLWSYANGMETGAVIALFGACLWWFVGRASWSRRDGLIFGALLAGLTFARLDQIFFAGALLLVMLVAGWRREGIRGAGPALIGGLAFAALVGAYLVYNKATVGSWLPLSGSVKSSFPRFDGNNLRHLRELFTQERPVIHKLFRQAQIHIPALLGLLHVLLAAQVRRSGGRWRIGWRAGEGGIDEALLATTLGVWLLAAYNFCFVPPYEQGTWYYPISTILGSLVLIRWGSWGMGEVAARRPAAAGRCVVMGALVAGSIWFFGQAMYRRDYNRDHAEFYLEEAPKIVAFYAARGVRPRVIEYYDGLFAAATGLPTLSGFGLVVDKEAAAAKKRGRLFRLAYSRGFDRVHSFYLNAAQLPRRSRDQAGLVGFIARFVRAGELANLELEVEYRSPRFTVLRVVPRPEAGEDEGE
jgi:hypothetical protein